MALSFCYSSSYSSSPSALLPLAINSSCPTMSCSPASSYGTFPPMMRTASSSDSTKNTCRDFCALRRMAAAAAQGRVRVGADRVDVAPLCKISSGYNKSGRVWITRAANEEAGHYSFTGDPVADAQVQERLRRELRDTGMLTFPRNTEKEDHTQARIFKMAANRGDILAVEDMEMEDPCAAEISGEEDCKVEAELGLEEKEIESDRLDLDSSKTSLEGNIEDMEESDVYARFGIRNGREVYQERAYLVGVELKSGNRNLFGIHDSLKELAQLADTAGLKVVGSTYQRLEHPSPKTYISSGKVVEVQTAVRALNVETVIFDDEISPGQLRNLEKTLGKQVRVCDRTALILDIFSQRAATREATLQVDLAQTDYQLPRLTQMWSHLERQAGGMVKGMGEKQIEVDKRILRSRIASLKRELESVRSHRQQYRDRRAAVPIPVISLVGYTNAGKSTLLNKLSGADVLAEDRLFATLDPITKRVELPNGKVCLFTDTVGFIQKLPTQLVAAFRATLEEISDSSLILHVVDISHPMAEQQIKAVEGVLDELEVEHIPSLCIWNKVDKARDPAIMKAEAKRRSNVVCISALTGEGMQDFYDAIESKLKDLLVWIEAVVPYQKGDLVDTIHRLGIVEEEEYMNTGTLVKAHVPLGLSKQLLHLRQPVLSKC
ncbi:hypothetical protein O6H91_10G054000 [Diphasiastrum complanatum]|uniref:Uncharacterized protein n=1 Tax=Diphasiastrum complanatum TaxID=34168 RepID=A0ACC2CHA8_DIPCM|nr:hypothetical protein O6H91_10G054000 [Diphasiastrum complanatum]